ncbi:hypothetical protein [Lacticaseibacillus kribbianus]|uniref:hypothetical protein n=1 Tax=Lacticaseibacillus kribbianus TaxID=2926292 RepID=UPI001CD3DE56|nr:hypothetical protein [Lacticaseibacillus kribbianus]
MNTNPTNNRPGLGSLILDLLLVVVSTATLLRVLRDPLGSPITYAVAAVIAVAGLALTIVRYLRGRK